MMSPTYKAAGRFPFGLPREETRWDSIQTLGDPVENAEPVPCVGDQFGA
jgi:hypothetical protein